MFNLSFIPSTTATKPARDFWQTLSSEKNSLETDANDFDQFLERANQNQFEIKQSQDNLESIRPAEIEAKQSEPGRDQSIIESSSARMESEPKPAQEAAAGGEKTGPSQHQSSDSEIEDQKIAAEAQNEAVQQDGTSGSADQEELLAILAQLAQVEAVETAELTGAMANPELAETIQVGSEISAINSVINKVELKDPTETVIATDSVKSNPEKSTETVLTGASFKSVLTAKSDSENSTEGKTAGLGQLNQTLPQASEKSRQSEGDSLFNQEQNSDSQGQTFQPVKILQNVNPAVEGRTVNEMGLKADLVTPKADVQAQPENNQVLVSGATVAKDGKVDLAMLQTQLAVNDAPKAKTETPELSIVSVQPSVNNASQVDTSGAAGVNPTNREELFSQIVEHAKVMINNGGSEMEVDLKPEHLGKLQLKVTIENEVVTAKFVAESQQVKEIIESNLGQLKRDLQESGMQVDAIMVSVGNHQGSESFEQTADNQDGSGRFKGQSGLNDQDFGIASEDSGPLAQTESLIDLIA